jgi:hypothetical protein
MSFLIKNDCKSLINAADLAVIIASDDLIFNQAIKASTIQAKSYLNSRFDVEEMFIDVLEYSFTETYAIGSKVFLFAAKFITTKVYAVGDYVEYNGIVYKCILIPTAFQLPTNATYFTAYGTNETLYDCILSATGRRPNETTYFTAIADRNPLLVRLMVDLVLYELHSRINPNNIPEFRIVRYDKAVRFLMDSVDTRKNVNPNFPLITFADDKGVDTIFGATINNNSY